MEKAKIMNAQELGTQLKTVRQERNLSVEAVSRVLYLRPSIVLELESGQYREIGALLYAKNYLRKYAKFLGIQAPEFEDAIESMAFQSDPKSQGFYETGKVKLEAEEQKRSNNFKYYLIFVVLVLGVCAYLYKTGVIPSPFKEISAKQGDEAVFLPNERLPSLELEYGVRGNITSLEDVSFEDLLIDAVKEQQNTLINEYHGDESIVQLQAESYGENEDSSHLVLLNRESELNVKDVAGGEDLQVNMLSDEDQLVVGQDQNINTERALRVKTPNRTQLYALGDALRNYEMLLSETPLPLIDLGSKNAVKVYVAPKKHLYYAYQSPKDIRFGIPVSSVLAQKLADLHRYTTSIYDRESGFYPFIDRTVMGFRLAGLKIQSKALVDKENALNQTLLTLKDSDEMNEKVKEKEIVSILQSLNLLEDHKVALTAKIESVNERLMQKSTIVIAAEDITTLDVQDVKGRVLANKVMKSGDEYQLEGSGIYDVYLGNPAVVDKIMVNGKVIPEYYYKPLTEEAVSIRFSLNAEQYH